MLYGAVQCCLYAADSTSTVLLFLIFVDVESSALLLVRYATWYAESKLIKPSVCSWQSKMVQELMYCYKLLFISSKGDAIKFCINRTSAVIPVPVRFAMETAIIDHG